VSASEALLDSIAAELETAARDRRPIPQISAAHPGLTPADAYAIQQRIVAGRLADGARIVGWKIGLTSLAMQQQLGVDQPDYGPILDRWLVPSGDIVATADLIAPRVEAEIAFILAEPLRGPGVTTTDVRRATLAVAPAIEVIDSRIADWKLTLVDTVADLASSARVVLGDQRTLIDDLDLRLVGVVFEQDGEVAATGAGAACLGDPLAAVAWAANTLGALGVTLEAGHIIMPGALHASLPARAGASFRARFDRLGDVAVRFS